MSKRRIFAALAAVSAASLTLAACSGGGGDEGGGDAAGGDAETYVLGAAMALTGDQASLGYDFTRFIEYGADDANEAYAEDGIALDVITEDTQATAEVGVQALNKLTTVDGAPWVTTAWSSVVNAMAPMAEDLDVAIVNAGANAPELEGLSPMLANFYTLASVEMDKFANWLYEEYDFEDAAVIYVDNPSGEGGGMQFAATWEEAGGTIVANDSVAPNATDPSSVVTKVLTENPELVHVHTLSTEGGAVIKTLRDQGFEGQITTFQAVAGDSAARDVAGEAANGIIYSTVRTFDPADPQVAELIERFNEEEGRDPVGLAYSVSFYDSSFLYAEVLKQLRDEGKEVTGTNLIAAMRGATFDLPIQGEATFTDNLSLEGATEFLEIVNYSDVSLDDTSIAIL